MSGCIIFNVKLNFTCEVRYVLDSLKEALSEGSTYARVVSCKSTRITFVRVALNNVDIWAYNI